MGAPFDLLPHLDRRGDTIWRGEEGLDLQDNLDWISERRFRVNGRKDQMVQVGGVNVSPRHVRHVLMSHGGLRDVAIRPGEGRLRAFVVPLDPQADYQQIETELRRHADAQLKAAERPQTYSFGAELPRNAMGKLADWPALPV